MTAEDLKHFVLSSPVVGDRYECKEGIRGERKLLFNLELNESQCGSELF